MIPILISNMENYIQELEPHQVVNPIERGGPGDFFQAEYFAVKSADFIVLACGHGHSNVVEPCAVDFHNANRSSHVKAV